jgi:hypothetical protein
MRTYRVAPLRRGTDGWTVVRSSSGEADETLGHYLDRADAQTALEHLVAAEARAEIGSQPDTRYEIFQDGGAYKIRITRLGNFKREADGFASRADAESWIAQAKRLGAVRPEQQEIAPSHLKVVKP